MAATDALFTAGLVVGAPDARLGQAAAWPKNGLTPVTGVVYAGVSSLLTATATMDVSVAALHFVGSKDAQQGVYVGANDGPYALTIAAAPGSGSRTDKVYIMQQDSNVGTTSPDASTAPLIAATSGSLPAGAVQIGTVTVPAGITKLTDAGVVIATTCRWLAAAGAPLPVRTQAERDAVTAYAGLQVIRLDASGRVETYTGSVWDFTDWTNLPIPAGGWSAPTEPTGHRWQATYRNGRVSFRGVLSNSAYTGGWTTICTLPAGIPAPADTLALNLAGNGNTVRSAQITPAGEVQVYAAVASAAWFVLGGGYPVG